MKNIYLPLTCLILLLSINSCTNDEAENNIDPFEVDLKVSSNLNPFYYENSQDINDFIDENLVFDFSGALEDDIERTITINNDTTLLNAQINFKPSASENYYDNQLNNNTIQVQLIKTTIPENILALGSSIAFCDMVTSVNNEISSFDFNSFSPQCIPVVFHISEFFESECLNQQRQIEMIDKLNANFQGTKLSFSYDGTQYRDGSEYYNLNVENTNFNFDVPNKLNVYISNSITTMGTTPTGLGTWPTQGPDRVYLVKQFLDNNNDPNHTVFTHEVGHNLSLMHTFQSNSCPGQINDDIPTLPFDSWINSTGSNINLLYGNSCSPADANQELILRNYMSYSMGITTLRQNCDYFFVLLQRKRLAFAYNKWKSHLTCNSNAPQSEIQLSSNLDFGNVQVNTNSSIQTLTVSNTGNLDFNITNISSSNNAFTILNGQSTSVASNSSVDFNIQFNPSNEQSYNGVITVDNTADNANSSNSSIQITGIGVNNNSSAISISGNLNFGDVEVGQTDTRTFTISNTGSQSFNVSSISFPSGVYSASWNSGVVNAGGSQNVTVTFQPNNVQTYNGTVTVNHNANGGNNTIPISGNGINNNTNQPNIIFNTFEIDDDNSGSSSGDDDQIAEAGEDIELNVYLQNIGNGNASNVDVILTTSDPDITITDDDRSYGTIIAGTIDDSPDFDFTIDNNCPTKTVTFNLQITSDQGTWNDSFTINIQGSSGGNPISITPTDSCSSSPIMQVDTEYEVNINVGNYSFGSPIDNESAGGNNIRGFWLAVQIPQSFNGLHIVKINNVSQNFNPVIGFKDNCNGGYYGNTASSPYAIYANNNGNGGNEIFETSMSGQSQNNGIYYIRIYHYDGSQTPNISFKIIVE